MKRAVGWGVLLLFSAPVWGAAEVAKVNGHVITDQDVFQSLSGFTEAQRRNLLKNRFSRHQVVESLIDRELLVQQAKRLNLQKTKEYAEAMEQFQKQLLATMLAKKAFAPKITDKALERYHQKNSYKFSTTQVHAFHIVLDSEARAREILKAAKRPGADFAELAERFSTEPSAKTNRGDLGYFTRDQWVSEFTDPVFRAKSGAIIGPIRTSYGYHIVKVIDKKVGRNLEYHEVEQRVRGAFEQELLKDYLDSLKKKSKIERKYSEWVPKL